MIPDPYIRNDEDVPKAFISVGGFVFVLIVLIIKLLGG